MNRSKPRELEIRPLTEELWRPAIRLSRSIRRELNIPAGGRSVKAELAIFASPWLGDEGQALGLLKRNELVGYGWVRDELLMGRECVHTDMCFARPARTEGYYRVLADRLLELAGEFGRAHGWQDIMTFCSSVDTIHPPLFRALGFRDLPMSWICFNHNLVRIPERPAPPGVTVRPARMPEELPRVMEFARRCFEDPETQGITGHEQIWNMLVDEIKASADPERILVAETADGLVGHITLSFDDAPVGAALIGECGVAPEWRRRGLAAHLGCRVLLHSRRRRRRRVVIYEPSTSPAGGLIWRLGFRPDALNTLYYFTRPV